MTRRPNPRLPPRSRRGRRRRRLRASPRTFGHPPAASAPARRAPRVSTSPLPSTDACPGSPPRTIRGWGRRRRSRPPPSRGSRPARFRGVEDARTGGRGYVSGQWMCHREAIVDGRRGTERRRRGRLHDAMCAWEAFDCRGHAPSREARERPEVISNVEPTRASPPRRGVPRSPRGSPSSSRVFTRRASTNDPAPRGGFGINLAGWCYTRETPRCDVLRASGPTSKPFLPFASAVFPRRGAQCDARASGASSPLARWRFAR